MGGARLSPFLLDTHVWFWHLSGSDRLPAGLRRAIDETDDPPWLSPISIWELGMLAKKRRVEIDRPYREWTKEALIRFPVEEAPLTHEIAVVSGEIDLPYPDPADRFLAATAIVHGLTLLTVDRRLSRAKGVRTRSR
ncbi:MAG: type II toxin-antitoxin system VapC family toxin [Candidatus Binatia bacterium]